MEASKWQQKAGQAQYFCCCLLAFSFPLPFTWASVCIWLLLLTWLLRGQYADTGRRLRSNRGYWLWIGFFLLYALSYTYSADKAQAGFEIVQRLSFVLLPVLVGAGIDIDRRRWVGILSSFVAGITAVALGCMAKAAILWQQTGDPKHLFYHDLVSGLDANAVYMAWYVVFSLSALLLFRWEGVFGGRRQWLRWTLIFIQLLFLILLSSRLLLVIFFLVTIPLYLAGLYRNLRLSRLRLGIAVAGFAGIILALVFTQNPVRQRFSDVLHNDFRQSFLPDYRDNHQNFNNLTLRIFVWRVGVENLKAHNLWWTGAGIGDVQAMQNRRIAEYGIRNMDDANHPPPTMYNMNLHNMYLQTVIALGLPGLLVFLVLIFSPFFLLRRVEDKRTFFIFHFSACAFMLQESIFQTQAGIIYYTFFSVIFWQIAYKKKALPDSAADSTH